MDALNKALEAANKAAIANREALQAAYSSAVEAGDEFAVIYLLNIVGEASQLQGKVRAAMMAANMSAKGGKL